MCQIDLPTVEVRGFKWPRRPTSIAMAYFLGEDTFGTWLGVVSGSPWWSADHSKTGFFEASFVKVVPDRTFWTACFNSFDPVVDVDIVLPVTWLDGAVEEVDLELDILRSTDGTVCVRDRDEFERVRSVWEMPSDVVSQAESTCERVCTLMQGGIEPFGEIGPLWLSRFLAKIEAS